MLTDAPPRQKNRELFAVSDRTKMLELPSDGRLLELARSMEAAMNTGVSKEVDRVCEAFLSSAAKFYQVPNCAVRVLSARPLRVRKCSTSELFGDYDPSTMAIRVWMRTAIRKEVTAFGTFFSTLCHEFCHHLDFQRFGFRDSWHTRGFYERTAALYHHSRGTPIKPLFWIPVKGRRWRIDWSRTNRRRIHV